MRDGWIPLHKGLARELPHDRPFTRLEAMFSLTLNYDQGNTVTVKGLAASWGWSRGKVDRFLEEIGVSIKYSSDTRTLQNQNGQIMIHGTDRTRAQSGQIKAIDSRWLQSQSSTKRADDGHETSRSQSTIIKPNPKPINTCSFLSFWTAYPRKVSKAQAQKVWQKINPDSFLQEQILKSLEWQSLQPDWQKEGGKFIPHPATWLNGRRWEDEQPTAKGTGQTDKPDYMLDPAYQEAAYVD